jgi:hypothetical protein
MHGAHRCRRTALPVDEPRGPDLRRNLAQRERTGRVPLEKTTDQLGGLWIRLDDLLSIWPGQIPVSSGGSGKASNGPGTASFYG